MCPLFGTLRADTHTYRRIRGSLHCLLLSATTATVATFNVNQGMLLLLLLLLRCAPSSPSPSNWHGMLTLATAATNVHRGSSILLPLIMCNGCNITRHEPRGGRQHEASSIINCRLSVDKASTNANIAPKEEVMNASYLHICNTHTHTKERLLLPQLLQLVVAIDRGRQQQQQQEQQTEKQNTNGEKTSNYGQKQLNYCN